MKKYFSVECPNCNHEIKLMVEITPAENGSVRIEDLRINTSWFQSVGNSTHVHRCVEVPASAAPSIPVVSDVRDVNVNVTVVNDENEQRDIDAIVDAIEAGGYVPNGNLFRRWIMAQDAHAEASDGGITAWIHRKGYEYMWTSAIHELEVTLKIRERDPQNYMERIRFMKDSVFVAMAKDYVIQLREWTDAAHRRRFEGKEYIRFPRQRGNRPYMHNNQDVLVSRIQCDIIAPLERLISKMERSTYRTFVDTLKEFNKRRIVIRSFTQCREWIDAYKAIGAWYTLKNAVLFHNLYLVDENEQHLTGTAALAYLDRKAEEYSSPDDEGHEQGYKLYGLKREAMEYNSFDFEERLRELGVRN